MGYDRYTVRVYLVWSGAGGYSARFGKTTVCRQMIVVLYTWERGTGTRRGGRMARRFRGALTEGPNHREPGQHRVASENTLFPYLEAAVGVAPDEVVEVTMQSQSFCGLFAGRGRNLRSSAIGLP